MIGTSDLEGMSDNLFTYDVVQGAWEQEPHGFEANARHVLIHLIKDLVNKNFRDPELVRSAIAPDSLQYALRLGRWTNQAPGHLITPASRNSMRSIITLAAKSDRLHHDRPFHQIAYMEAAGVMATNLHDLDHRSTRESALAARDSSMRSTAGLLIYCAEISSEEYRFDVNEAFDGRLTHLRNRFGIPLPVQ